jgi:hypothetical protein
MEWSKESHFHNPQYSIVFFLWSLKCKVFRKKESLKVNLLCLFWGFIDIFFHGKSGISEIFST